jgi:hypothetical protein
MADIFTDAGEALVADILDGTSVAPTWRAAWGTGAGTSAKGDTTLFSEAAEARVVTANTQPLANQNQMVATITAASAKTITNAGIFDAASAGNLLVKSDFAGISLAIGDKIKFTFKLTFFRPTGFKQ